jgi:hypothetical protein
MNKAREVFGYKGGTKKNDTIFRAIMEGEFDCIRHQGTYIRSKQD